MKILHVDLEFDYGNPSRGPNTIGKDGFQRAFTELGHTVIPFYYDSYLTRPPADLQSSLISAADENQPDLIFFCLFQNQFHPTTLDRLKERYQTMNWFGDDSWRFDSFTRIYASHFTFSITTDKFALPKYAALGLGNVILSQWAAMIDPETPAFDEAASFDVTFVGSCNPHRRWLLDRLQRRGIQIKAFGQGWPAGKVSTDFMKKIFRQSKINLNLANSTNYDIRYLLRHPRNLWNFLRSDKASGQIKARNFEIPYFGGFQLTDYYPSIEDFFLLGKEIACFRDVDEAEMLIGYYLKNDSLRQAITRQGYQRARKEHTYTHRFAEIFSRIANQKIIS